MKTRTKLTRKEIKYGLICFEQESEFSKYSCKHMKMYELEVAAECLEVKLKYKKAFKMIKLNYEMMEIIKLCQKG